LFCVNSLRLCSYVVKWGSSKFCGILFLEEKLSAEKITTWPVVYFGVNTLCCLFLVLMRTLVWLMTWTRHQNVEQYLYVLLLLLLVLWIWMRMDPHWFGSHGFRYCIGNADPDPRAKKLINIHKETYFQTVKNHSLKIKSHKTVEIKVFLTFLLNDERI
jgi:hypothetical protein